jgi:hypothetical protein
VNNPLTAVVGYAQLLAHGSEPGSTVADRLEKIVEHAVRIRDMIQPVEEADD